MINSVAGINVVVFLITFSLLGLRACGRYFNLALDVCYGDRKIHVFHFAINN